MPSIALPWQWHVCCFQTINQTYFTKIGLGPSNLAAYSLSGSGRVASVNNTCHTIPHFFRKDNININLNSINKREISLKSGGWCGKRQ